MANVLFLGDLHAGHKAIAKYRTMFRDEQDHFEYVEQEYHKRVSKRDKCIFTGDVVFSHERLAQIKKWPGYKQLVLGNHCCENLSIKELIDVFDDIQGLIKYKEFWLSHAPIHPAELRGKFNIHGHVHDKTVQDWRYFNTSLEYIGYKPISLHEIRMIMEKRKSHYEQYGFYNVSQDKIKSEFELSKD